MLLFTTLTMRSLHRPLKQDKEGPFDAEPAAPVDAEEVQGAFPGPGL
jgi:hypothetical protein